MSKDNSKNNKINFRMKQLFIYLTYSIMFFSLFGCSSSQKIAALKPEPSLNTPLAYKTTTSFVNMPMDFSLQEIG